MKIYLYNIGPKALPEIARTIINHKDSLTTLCSSTLRKLITPIISACPYLTKDVHQTINNLRQDGPPALFHRADIEKFYPNTPHSLIIEAFAFYYPLLKGERHILRCLLNYNFATDRQYFYHLGDIGIPMGLPLASELARMSTAYLLRNYSPPPNEHLTLYFDDVAASYPIEDLPLAPYSLKTTTPYTTQDCDPVSRKFKPYNNSTDNRFSSTRNHTTHPNA